RRAPPGHGLSELCALPPPGLASNVLSYFHFRKKTPELSAMAAAKYQRTSELMGVELEYLVDRRPTKLSGGEKQRVALGRCITRDPTLFLLDEPFSNLDQALRERRKAGAPHAERHDPQRSGLGARNPRTEVDR